MPLCSGTGFVKAGDKMSELRIALSAWNGRISPVFDVAQKLLLVDVAGGREVARTLIEMNEQAFALRAAKLKGLGANVLLCGAISKPLVALIASSRVKVVPFLAGEVEDVLTAYLDSRLPAPEFMMPGCPCPARGRRRRRGYRGGRAHRRAQR